MIKSAQIYHIRHHVSESVEPVDYIDWTTIYLSLLLATTLMCTLLIVYRILSVGGIKAGLRTYRGVIEVTVESAALFSAALIIYISLNATGMLYSTYADVITASIKVGRVCLLRLEKRGTNRPVT